MGSRSMPLITSSSMCKTAPKWSMRGRASAQKDGTGKVPGPGTYGLPATEKTRYSRAPQAQFGTSLRDGIGMGGKAMPGPGQYAPQNNLEQTPKWGFGTSLRGSEGSTGRSRAPGPGAYDVRTDLGGTQISMTARNMGLDGKRALTPGPGTYAASLNNFESAPRFGFGTSLRPGLSRPSKVPGPGTYTQTNSMGGANFVTTASPPKYSMKPRRNPVTSGDKTPGPSFIFTQFG